MVANVPVCGIEGKMVNSEEMVTVHLESKQSSFKADVQCLIVPKVSAKIPSTQIRAVDWPIPKEFRLADPKFDTPSCIDMLIGAGLYFRLLKEGSIQLGENYPELRETHLGWVVAGGAGCFVAGPQFAGTASISNTSFAGRSPSPGGGCSVFDEQ